MPDVEPRLMAAGRETPPKAGDQADRRAARAMPSPRLPSAPAGHGTVALVDFASYYEQHLAKLIRHLMRQGARPHEAAEAAQAAFTEAYAQWDTIRHPAAWLRQVALRLFLRQPAHREELTGAPPDRPGGICPLGAVELKEEENRVYAALAALPPLQRQVLAWHLDGFGLAEIAAALGKTPEAVRQNLSRGRARLKEMLLREIAGGGK
ncbi:RNA polymerase sigma factor [Streptomyces ochraceiscleroticus]|uniref:RNA polymerase sigma factor n=1 Tax=Streptomyces ochraceiscleroticus TaxID=47761 RepID=A0ABW1MN27_9ACTN|nr:sigma-70 family RNA polymerase sigma factor [Streptomyces ochraceiscleroticus]